MLIPTAVGVDLAGHRRGPSTTSWILKLDLTEVSTIVGGTATQQLTLADLGTDCPQTADPTAIATLVDRACDPILAAPKQVSSWAYPCNACGRLGLFDPPYAVPPVTGGLLGTTTVVTTPTTTTTVTTPTLSSPVPPPFGSTTAAPLPSSTFAGTTTVAVVSSASSTPSTVQTAAAPRFAAGGLAWLVPVAGMMFLF